ncbi:MAG: hypothetical protein AB7G11_04565 [Phycisphaerales bacterium]
MRSSKRSAVLLASCASLGVSMSAFGQTASAILRVGDMITPEGVTVSSVTQTAASQTGGYAVNTNCSDGLSRVWGNFTGGAGDVIRTEGTFGTFMQTSFEAFFGVGGTSVAYSPLGSDSGFTGLDAVFVNDSQVMAERVPHPSLPGQFWSFGSRPSVTAGGVPWFVGGITATQGGSTSNRGLFTGASGEIVVLMGGQSVPGYAEPLNTATTVDFDYRVSSSGEHFIAPVVLTGATTADAAIVVDGSAAMAGGSVIREGTIIPVAAGGDGVILYQNFDFMGITDSGMTLLTGDSNAATTADEFVMLNGSIILRDGDTVSGQVVQGDIEGAYLNNNGDWGVIWDTATNTIETLIVNGAIVVREGDTVDFDGDGVAEPDSILTAFTGTSSLAIGPRVNGAIDVYFIGTATVAAVSRTAAFHVRVLVGTSCPCDWNDDGVVNSQDFFNFLTDFFADAADFNNDGATNSQDFFDFLACFFEACP